MTSLDGRKQLIWRWETSAAWRKVSFVFFFQMNVSVFGGLKRYQTNLDQSHSFGVKLDSSI